MIYCCRVASNMYRKMCLSSTIMQQLTTWCLSLSSHFLDVYEAALPRVESALCTFALSQLWLRGNSRLYFREVLLVWI